MHAITLLLRMATAMPTPTPAAPPPEKEAVTRLALSTSAAATVMSPALSTVVLLPMKALVASVEAGLVKPSRMAAASPRSLPSPSSVPMVSSAPGWPGSVLCGSDVSTVYSLLKSSLRYWSLPS